MAIKHDRRGADYERRKQQRQRRHDQGGQAILRFPRAAKARLQLERGELAAWAAIITGLVLLATLRLAGV